MDDTLLIASAVVLLCLVVAFLIFFRPRASYQIVLVNNYRRKYRLRAVTACQPLDGFARAHSRYLARHRACNHDHFQARAARIMKAARTDHVGENCIQYPSTEYDNNIAVRLIEEWMESPEHRANILNPGFSKMGIGVIVKGKYVYATQIFCA